MNAGVTQLLEHCRVGESSALRKIRRARVAEQAVRAEDAIACQQHSNVVEEQRRDDLARTKPRARQRWYEHPRGPTCRTSKYKRRNRQPMRQPIADSDRH